MLRGLIFLLLTFTSHALICPPREIVHAVVNVEAPKNATSVDGPTLTVRGSTIMLDCDIPVVNSPADKLKGRWVLGAGGSVHWGGMMNLLRLLQPLLHPTPAKLYNVTNMAHRKAVDCQTTESQIFPLVAGGGYKQK